MKVRYTLPALAELEEILDYLILRSPQGATRVQMRIKYLIELLTLHPYIGARTDDATIRRLVVTPYPYLVLYEIADDEIIVHHIRHAARDPSTIPGSP